MSGSNLLHPTKRSVVWIRTQDDVEIVRNAGAPLYPWRPQHPADAKLEGGEEGSRRKELSQGCIKLITRWELGQVEDVLDEHVNPSHPTFMIKVGETFPSGKVPLTKQVQLEDVFLANPSRFDGVADMCRLSELSAPCLLHNLVVRFRAGLIYTYTGPLLISINPFQPIAGLYDDSTMSSYRGSNVSEKDPHVFAAAESALQSLFRDKMDQSIVISGESGAGKTEAAKSIMRYLAFWNMESGDGTGGDRSSEDEGGEKSMERVFLQTNPLTEAFGNAKTIRNDNSSRFGKFIRIHVTKSHRISEAYIEHYLLEKSRVTHQAEGERNYHIFYQLCAGAGEDMLAVLKLSAASAHKFSRQGKCLSIPGVDDSADFRTTKNALSSVGIPPTAQEGIWRILAGILHLGDIEFGALKDGSGTMNDGAEDVACRVLGLEPADARTALCQRKIKAGLEVLQVPKSRMEAILSRDAVSRALYTRLFDWLLERINEVLSAQVSGSSSSSSVGCIGLLDIFGFEILEENGFEQLCINYANEKLQRYFNDQMLSSEQEEYAAEEVEWVRVDYEDNLSVLELLEGKPEGILPILDDQCLFATATDSSFLQVLSKKHASSKDFTQPKLKHTSFLVKHSAGSVEYLVLGFLDKNKDQLYSDLTELLASSRVSIIKDMFSPSSSSSSSSSSKSRQMGRQLGSKASQHISVSAKFREQLQQLMKTLARTRPTFVRCIKPNAAKAPLLLHAGMVDHQLRCSGVYAAVKIAQAGYPSRISFLDFATRYRMLVRGSHVKTLEEAREQSRSILLDFCSDSSLYQLGKHKIFMKGGVLARLEEVLSHHLTDAAALLQGSVRRRRTSSMKAWRRAAEELEARARRAAAQQKHIKRLMELSAVQQLGSCLRRNEEVQRLREKRGSATLLQKMVRGRQTRLRVNEAKLRQRLLLEKFAGSSSSPRHLTEDAEAAPLVRNTSFTGSAAPSLAHILSEMCEAGTQTDSAGRLEGGGGGGVVRLSSGKEVDAEEVEQLLRDRERLLAVVGASQAGASSPLVLKHSSLRGLMAGMPSEEEVKGQAVLSGIRRHLIELENLFEVARVGLRQTAELSRALQHAEKLEKEVEELRGRKEVYEGMQKMVRLQEAELREKTSRWEEEKATLEEQLLESNIRRVKVEEELDNFRHWQEVNLPDLQQRSERLKELEPEYEDLIHELTTSKIRLAEMDEANCVLAQELRKLRPAHTGVLGGIKGGKKT